MIRFLIPISCCLLLMGCYDSSFGEKPIENLPSTSTISELHQLYSEGEVAIEADISVEGIVTSSDDAQNFFRTLVLEKDGAAIEVLAGIDHLSRDYPIGAKVNLKLKGLELHREKGVLQVGRKRNSENAYESLFLGSPAAVKKHLRVISWTKNPIVPVEVGINDLSPAMCGRLVLLTGLNRYTQQTKVDGENGNPVWSGYTLFHDADGFAVETYVSPYATFATSEIPIGEVDVVGILQLNTYHHDGRYCLKLRQAEDCQPSIQ